MIRLLGSMLSVILCFFPTIILLCSSKDINIKLLTNSDTPCSHTELCLTLEQFSENADQYSQSNVSLTVEFLPGDHRSMSPVTVYNISNLIMYSRTKTANIVCYRDHFAYFELINITFGQLISLTFLGCGLGDSYVYIHHWHPALKICFSDLSIQECKFHNTRATVIDAFYCNITIFKSEFINSSKDIKTTAIEIHYSNLSIRECTFFKSKGRVVSAWHCSITIYKSEFNSSNGIHFTVACNMSDIGSFYYNNSIHSGIGSNRVLESYSSSVLNFSACQFYSNGDLFWTISTAIVLH